MTIAQLQQKFLATKGKRIAPEDFFILAAHATGKTKSFLLAHPEYDLDRTSETSARDYFQRCLQHEPVAYIVGHKEFYGYDFLVTKDTLIPRPETELIVERALDKISNFQLPISKKIVLIDVGTGSGNIIISLAKETEKLCPLSLTPYYLLLATDISEAALSVAKQNAKRHRVDTFIKFHKGSLLDPLDKKIFSADEIIITANLPYLSHDLYANAPENVRDYEPKEALLSGKAGLDHYYRLLNQVKDLKKLITLYLEISPEQNLPLQNFISELFPKGTVRSHKDLAGKDRVVEIQIHL